MGFKKIFLLVGCLVTVVSPIYFDDCGGYGFIVKNVDVEGCTESPCTISVGDSVTITVNSLNEVTNFTTLHSKAYIIHMGHSWELPVTPHDICLHWGGCPLTEYTTRSYAGDVYFNTTLLRRPGQLMLTAKYESDVGQIVAFCIRIHVDLV